MRLSRQEYWSGLPFPSPGDLPNPGIEPGSPTLQADSLLSEPPGKPAGTHSRCSIKLSLNEYWQILLDEIIVPTKELPHQGDLWVPEQGPEDLWGWIRNHTAQKWEEMPTMLCALWATQRRMHIMVTAFTDMTACNSLLLSHHSDQKAEV